MNVRDDIGTGPVFVVGANRSGTTLMRLLLNAHSRIGIPEELVYLGHRIHGVPVERWRSPGLSEASYTSFVEHFVNEVCRPLEGIDKDDLKASILSGPRDLRNPYATALSTWAASFGKSRWGEKTPGNLYYADILTEMFPDARFIYMTRDPRGGVASMQRAPFFSDDIVFNALAWRKHSIAGYRVLERAVPPHRRITVLYEELVSEPEVTMRAVCSFLDEELESEMLAFHRTSELFMKADAAAGFNAAATGPITTRSVDRWQHDLEGVEIAVIDHICRPLFSGSKFHAYPRRPGLRDRTEILIKRAYWGVQCVRHRDIRHFTVRDRMFARFRARLKRTLTGRLVTGG